MTTYLLDTNAISGAMRDPTGALATRMAVTPGLVTSALVAAELEFGSRRRGSRRLRRIVAEVLGIVTVLPFDATAAQVYARVRHDLEVVGQPVGALDTLVAAHALSIKAVLVTHNTNEFDRVRGLVVQDWAAAASD